ACGLEIVESKRGQREIGPDKRSRGQHSERIEHKMASRRTQTVSDGLPQYASFDRRRIGLQRYAEQLCVSAFVRTKGNDSSDTGGLRRGSQPFILARGGIE